MLPGRAAPLQKNHFLKQDENNPTWMLTVFLSHSCSYQLNEHYARQKWSSSCWRHLEKATAHWFERFWRVVVTLNTNNMDVCGIYPYIPHWLTQAVPPSVHHSPQGLGCRALSSLVWWEMTLLREQGLNWVILKGPFQHKPLHGSLKPHFPHTFCNEYRHTPHVGVFSVGFAGFFCCCCCSFLVKKAESCTYFMFSETLTLSLAEWEKITS